MQDVKQLFHEYAKETGGPTEAAAILTLAHILETEFDRRRPRSAICRGNPVTRLGAIESTAKGSPGSDTAP